MITVHIVDAFTDKVDTGNRAGVVLEADALSETEMQKIAKFAGYSETAFVLSSDAQDHDVHVRYFTPSSEVPICGHATIATHFLRSQLYGENQYPLSAKTGAGILPVSLSRKSGQLLICMKQGDVEFGCVFTQAQRDRLSTALGVDPDAFVQSLPIQVVSTGHSKVMVPMASRAVLDELTPNGEKLSELSAEVNCNGFYPFVLQGGKHNPETFGRMFAPAIGIYEDPVTGNANGPMGAYLAEYELINFDKSLTFKGHQGHAMGKPGTVFISVTRTNEKLEVSIAGEAVIAGTLEYMP